MPTIDVMPDKRIYLEKVCYHGVHIMQHFMKEDGDNRKEDQVDMDPYPDEEETEDMILDKERDIHWRMVFKDNDGGVDDDK